MKTLLNVNNLFYFNGDKITHDDYVKLKNTEFTKNVIINVNDDENNISIQVKI